MLVMSRDGTRWLGGVESANQRLADALGIGLGAYPAARDYGMDLDLLDRDATPALEARIAAEVGRVFQRPANGLSDMALDAVTITASDDDVVTVTVRALWRGGAGAAGSAASGTPLRPAGPPADALRWRGVPITWRGEFARWR